MPLFDAPPVDAAPGETLPLLVARHAAERPDATALVCDDQRMSWGELGARINQVANALIAQGLRRGDNVAILARNSPEYLEILLGTLAAGGCIVPLSTMASSEALEAMVVDSGARVLVLSDEMRPLVEPFAGVLADQLPEGRLALDFAAEGWHDYAGWRDAAPDSDPSVHIGHGDHFNIIYSSGTTGVPKGILMTHGVRMHIAGTLGAMQFGPESKTLLSTPLYSNTTLVALIATLAKGGSTVLMRRFDIEGYLALVERERCTHTMLVPVQYQRLLAHPKFDSYDLSSMQVKLSTSAPLRGHIKRDILDRFPGLMIEIYGLTEGGGGTVLNCSEHPDKLDSVGQPGLGTELKIIGEDGREVAPGEIGEIVARSPNMMKGYYKRDDLTEAMLWRDADGKVYFRSGDAGRLDADGFLYLSDRLKDMIISGGFNIYANDLELVLLQHPDVTDVAVIAIPSEEWGESPLGLVVLREGATAGPEEIRDWANARLGKTQRLAAVELRDELPRSSIGKILKRELRAPYWEGQ
ncbi:MAG TPA: AMP-binding protein [Alphaproteobacteria bacterium]|nr:AMP-binding protein [Alphaproteobacteria bacterium]